MTDSAISPILARLTDIVADLNRALDLARGQGVRHILSVEKTLTGEQPHFNVRLIDPGAPKAEEPSPSTERPATPTQIAAGTIEAPTPAITEGGIGSCPT